jgi:chemotaxis protein methyltransferase CheR
MNSQGRNGQGMNSQGRNSAQELEAVVDRVSHLLHQHIGLRPEPGLRGRLRGCIRDDAARLAEGFDTYVNALEPGSEALQSLLNRVTVQETAFFRHPEHFQLLAREILPTLTGPVTLWSAACANGQEAFSLAMVLEEAGVDGRVIATDLSTEALRRTSTARYTTRELGGLPLDRVGAHLTRDGDAWLVNSNIRTRVSTFRHNLLDPIPGQVSGCQVVFCRNVLIYFSPDHASAFLGRVADTLPAAWLFLGAAETIWQLSSRFETVRSGDTFSYRRRTDDAARASGPRATTVSSSRSRTTDLSGNDRLAPVPPPVRRPVAEPAAGLATDSAQTSTSPMVFVTVPPSSPSVQQGEVGSVEELRAQGERASASGDVLAAVVAFRKCAYLSPHDPITHLRLALALEGAGDPRSAQRAYAAARHALTHSDPAELDQLVEGYSRADLIRLLDSKQDVVAP